MSQENVEIVRSIYLASDEDYVQQFRDEETWAVTKARIELLFLTDFECTMPLFDSDRTYSGLDGLRCVWLDWMEPWGTYRIEIEEVVDIGERVLLLTQNFGLGEGNSQEVGVDAAAIWGVRNGKISHAAFYFDRAEALKVVSLAEQAMSQENMQRFHLANAAINRGDVEYVVGHSTDDVVVIVARSAVEGAFVGHEGLRWFFADNAANFELFHVRVDEVRDLGDDRVLAIGAIHVRGRGGVGLDIQMAGVATYRHGKLSRWEDFRERRRALEAVGLAG